MNKKSLETAATIALGVVCAGLVFHLAIRVRNVHAGAPPVLSHNVRSVVRPVTLKSTSGRAGAYPNGPVLNLALYDQIQSQDLRAPDRNPFSFEPTPAQVRLAQQARALQATTAAPIPPPPPPIPFQAVGYSVKADGRLEAYLAGNQQVYVVHTGDEFAKGYSVVMITSAMIEINDESLHRTVELPLPQ